MAEIQLLVTDEGNRNALAALIGEQHTPILDEEIRDVDLYLVDEPSFPTYRNGLQRRTQDALPVFCPVVLIRREQAAVTLDLPDPTTRKEPFLIDEVLTAPVGKQQLFRAIANLLARRRQTDKLQKRTEQLEELASTLRHELRNPLCILDLSLDDARESGREAAFERCQRAVNRMERMLEETLLIIEQGDIDIDTEPVALSTVATECWDIVLEPTAGLDVATDMCVYADSDRLRQLFANLFRNAVEHGGSDVTVTVGALDGGFYLEDDGGGIPDDERKHVFEEGYTTSAAGSGLGLAVVRAVVDAHGWEIRVVEGGDGGARFEITGVSRCSGNGN
jgi:signal transduction histidine kinase